MRTSTIRIYQRQDAFAAFREHKTKFPGVSESREYSDRLLRFKRRGSVVVENKPLTKPSAVPYDLTGCYLETRI